MVVQLERERGASSVVQFSIVGSSEPTRYSCCSDATVNFVKSCSIRRPPKSYLYMTEMQCADAHEAQASPKFPISSCCGEAEVDFKALPIRLVDAYGRGHEMLHH